MKMPIAYLLAAGAVAMLLANVLLPNRRQPAGCNSIKNRQS